MSWLRKLRCKLFDKHDFELVSEIEILDLTTRIYCCKHCPHTYSFIDFGSFVVRDPIHTDLFDTYPSELTTRH